ncbi:hypothetical protein BKA66DRAFT_462343 [Pyrenochaeta sp. MPI-SDFR-AT-0127]|nr:hypothetical protein BKA66DRAFT_462343 [Pyrenochaeta sp. MPI-SDFR-AT-0127]
MASNLRDLREYTLPDSGPQSTISVSLSSSSQSSSIPLRPTSTGGILINLSICQIQSSKPENAITIGAIRNVLDLSTILDVGVLALTNVESQESMTLYSAAYSPSVRPNIKFSWGRDIRESVDFVSIPSLESGESVTLAFELSIQTLRDLWARRSLKKSSAPEFPFTSPGKWRLHFVSKESIGFHHNGIVLWTWGALEGELQGKKFEYPTETRYPFEAEAEERMKEERREGKYVQLHPNDCAEVECFVAVETDTEGVIIEFVNGDQ